MLTTIPRHKTALRRSELSRPIKLAIDDGLLTNECSVFDYGCGYGDDIKILNKNSIKAFGWDPFYYSIGQKEAADVVNLGYVLNVIESNEERLDVLKDAWSFSNKILIVSVRLNFEANGDNHISYNDGYLTKIGTFQKFFDHTELRNWINSSLDVNSVAAAPGIFYVFRDKNVEQTFIASRYKRRTVIPKQKNSDKLYEENKTLLETLMSFISNQGRLPSPPELEITQEICNKFGSLKKAFSLIQKVTGTEQWDKIREDRSQDLLVYMALSRFERRPPFSTLPTELQLDIKSFFSTYKNACDLADDLLFSVGDKEIIKAACKKSEIGKQTPTSLYVHLSALPLLSSILRVYEGCARALVGVVDEANVVKLHFNEPVISYLSYPNFEAEPHPALKNSLTVNLQTFYIKSKSYTNSLNPPILHRKEDFIYRTHPLYPKFFRLTQIEQKHGLYEKTETIGTKLGWEKILREKKLRLNGHKVVKIKI